jgi:hypothetical protein
VILLFIIGLVLRGAVVLPGQEKEEAGRRFVPTETAAPGPGIDTPAA